MSETLVPTVGIDLGSVALKGTLLDAAGRVVKQRRLAVRGRLTTCLRELLDGLLDGVSGPLRLGVTGGAKELLAEFEPALAENDLVSAARAAALLYPAARGVVEVGGHQSKWSVLSPSGQLQSFSLNDQCAAGSGAFLEQQARRLQLDVCQLGVLAADAERAASIAGRCAVFAKSDMIHQQQKGTPPGEIAYGLCVALARNFRATLLRGGELSLPALFAGGGALNPGLYRAFQEVFELNDEQLLLAAAPEMLASHGVALAAREAQAPVTSAAALRSDVERPLALPGALSTRGLAPLAAHPDATLPEPSLEQQGGEGEVLAYLGIDVGSVSTDFCLLSPTGDVLDGIYLPTRGDPLAVLEEGLASLRRRGGERLRILGLGTTGSGRHLAGQLLGADVIKNEITCQLLGARHLVPAVDTILEIGGQDSKYVRVQDGRVADFVMNKICAAGTGSFLEEQGASLGVAIRGEFAEIALRGQAPADLGSQCTVFMDTEVVHARQRGASLPDILSGLAYSVARNYLERVVAGRPIGDTVVFQGGVASNEAVVAAFEQLLGKPVQVHPFNRLSGAIGAAVAAIEQRKRAATHSGQPAAAPPPSQFRGLDALAAVEARTFECSACSNVCQVSRISLGDQVTYFGDVCERYTARQAQGVVDDSLPDLFAELEELLLSYAGGHAWRGVVGIPRAVMMMDLFPLWATFLRTLGFSVVLSEPSSPAVLEMGSRRLTAETCLPIKLAFGHVASLLSQPEVDFVFVPSIMELPDCADQSCHLCPFEETVGFMVSSFATERMVIPTVSLSAPRPQMVRELRDKLQSWDVPEADIIEALDAADAAQQEFRSRLMRRGQEVLDEDPGLAFVVLGKPYNVSDPFANLSLARHIRRLGVLPLPMAMLPLEPADLTSHSAEVPWRYNRGILRAAQQVKQDPRLFPVVVSNFGCGPDAFAMKYLEASLAGSPSLFLEFDEHRGEAGLITRLEAFLDEVGYATQRWASEPISLPPPPQRAHAGYEGRRFVLPYIAEHAWAYLGALRFAGHEAILLPPPDEETLAWGEALSTGKECHPYVLIAGDLLRHIDEGTIRDGDVYLFPGTNIPCLLQQYGTAMRLALEQRGVDGVEVLSPTSAEQLDLLGMPAMLQLGRGLLACDMLNKLRCQVRPYAADPAAVDALIDQTLEQLAAKMAEDRPMQALSALGPAIDALPRREQPRRPLVGVAGDVYTRIHPFGNHDLFRKLEALGLEVWPSPFLVDNVDFGWRRSMSDDMADGRYLSSAATGLLYLRKEMERLKVRYSLGDRVERADEPGYQQVLDNAAPYVDAKGNEILLLNVAKMVDFARRGADGVLNAISIRCMLGTVSASLTESIRRDHGQIPISTLVYSGKASQDMDTKLEAFAHQVKAFAAGRPQPEERRGWFESLWR